METEKKETKKRKAEGSEKIVLVPHSPSSAGLGAGLKRSSSVNLNKEDEEEEMEDVDRLPPNTKADSPPAPWWREAAKWFSWFLAIVAYAAVVAAIVVWYAAIGAFIVVNIVPIALIVGVVAAFVLTVWALAKLDEWSSRQQEAQENEAIIDSVESPQPEKMKPSVSVSPLHADGFPADNKLSAIAKSIAEKRKLMEEESPTSSSSFRETSSLHSIAPEEFGIARSVSALPVSTIVSSEQPSTSALSNVSKGGVKEKELGAPQSFTTLSAVPVAPMLDSNVTVTPPVPTNTAQETKMSRFKNAFSGIVGMLSSVPSTVKGAAKFMLEKVNPLDDGDDDISDVEDTPAETTTALRQPLLNEADNDEHVEPETVIINDRRDDQGENLNRTVGLP